MLVPVIGANLVHPHSVLYPPRAVQHCTPLVAGGRVAVPDVPSALSVEPAMSRSSLRPLQRPVADCSARCTCLASQLMYAADAYPQANPAPAQGLPWHALLHTSRLAFHITAGTLVACSRAWPGHQRSVLNPLAPFSFVPPVAVGARFYRAQCPGVALYFSYSLRFVTLSLCDGDEASPSVLSVEPALCRSVLHPPLSRQVAALQCSRDRLRLPTSMQVYASPCGQFCSGTASLAMFSTTCARSPFSPLPSPWYQASHSWRVRLGHPHSVLGPLSAVQYCTPSQKWVADSQCSMSRSRPA